MQKNKGNASKAALLYNSEGKGNNIVDDVGWEKLKISEPKKPYRAGHQFQYILRNIKKRVELIHDL